ncbi:MAG: hypothetical protein KF726_26040 [Anaerolineae bacterium]|nr:hypothetical protein [Anaerolineae bacterium]
MQHGDRADRQVRTQDEGDNTEVVPAGLGWNWFSQADDTPKRIAHVTHVIRHIVNDSAGENGGKTAGLTRSVSQWESDGLEEVIGR